MLAQLALLLLATSSTESQSLQPPAPVAQAAAARAKPLRPVQREQQGPVAYDDFNGMIFFKAKVAGREVDAMLDTGATRSMVDIGFARGTGLNVVDMAGSVKAVGGELPVWPVTDVTVLIPGQFEVDFPALAGVDMAPAARAAKRKIAFVLGQDFVRNFVLVVNPAKKVFFFAPSGKFAPDNSVKAELQGGKPQLLVQIADDQASVLLDTGFNGQLTLAPEDWKRIVGQDPRSGTTISVGADGTPQASHNIYFSKVKLGGMQLDDVQASSQASATAGVGKLGMGILKRFMFAIDIRAGVFWLAPLPPQRLSN